MPFHRLTPAMRDLLQRIRRANRTPMHLMDAADARRHYDASAEILDLPRAPLTRVENLHVPVAPGVARAGNHQPPVASGYRPRSFFFTVTASATEPRPGV